MTHVFQGKPRREPDTVKGGAGSLRGEPSPGGEGSTRRSLREPGPGAAARSLVLDEATNRLGLTGARTPHHDEAVKEG